MCLIAAIVNAHWYSSSPQFLDHLGLSLENEIMGSYHPLICIVLRFFNWVLIFT